MIRTCAYLDIETTDLSPVYADLTVVGEEICASKLLQIFKKVKELFTYNGSRFDLPFIQGKLGNWRA